MLPATTLDRVTGRFLYGVSMMGFAAVLGGGLIVIYRLLGFEISVMSIPLCLIALAVGILMMTVEYIFFYLFGENVAPNLLGLVRVLPGMLLFFLTADLYKNMLDDPDRIMRIRQIVSDHLNMIGWGSIAVAAAVLIAATVFCAKMTEKRDY